MAKKNYEELEILQVAIARIKSVREQDAGDNIKFSEALGLVERRLLDEMFELVSKKFKKPSNYKAQSGGPKGAFSDPKGNERNGKPKQKV